MSKYQNITDRNLQQKDGWDESDAAPEASIWAFFFRELDQYIAEVDRKVKVLENPSYLSEEIKALDADRVKAESLKLFLQSSDRRKDLEVRRRIACVNRWLNHKTEIVKSGDSESEGYVG